LSGCVGGGIVVGVFLDIAKAFDCISHTVLLSVLSDIGCDAQTLSWFSSFLGGRQVRVIGDHTHSSFRVMDLGLAQGSTLGPFLFIIYLNIVLKFANSISPNLCAIAYADDTTILFRSNQNSIDADLKTLASFLEMIMKCFDYLKLSINVQKTQLILFSPNKSSPIGSIPDFYVRGVKLPLMEKVICRGITLDRHFSWQPYAGIVCTKLNKVIATLHRLSRVGVPQKTLILLLKSLFIPVVSYGILVWGSTFNSTLHPLSVCYNNALRVIFKINRRTSVTHLYKLHDLLDVKSTFRFHMCCFAFQSVHNLLPHQLNSHVPHRDVPLRNDRHLNLPLRPVLSDYMSRSPLNQVTTQWNSLPTHLKTISNLSKFKTELKLYLLSNI